MDSSRAIYKSPEVPHQKHETTDCPRSRPFFVGCKGIEQTDDENWKYFVTFVGQLKLMILSTDINV